MNKFISRIISSIILFSLSFTIFAFLFGRDDILRWLIQGAIFGTVLGIFTPCIQNWRKKLVKK